MKLICTTRAQSSVEAALLIPVFFTILLLALQPVCVFYTRSVMESAASGAARVLMTWDQSFEPADVGVKAYILRRLQAVPAISIFHDGGQADWEIELEGDETSKTVQVKIAGRVRPLPVLGAFVGFMGSEQEDGSIRVEVELTVNNGPSWREGTYEDWISFWQQNR